jgi:hypothetical protein
VEPTHAVFDLGRRADRPLSGCRDNEQVLPTGERRLQFRRYPRLDHSTNAPATQRATAAAAGAAANDVDILAKLAGAFRNGAPDGALGVATIDSSGHVIADASLDPDGDLSVYGSGSAGDASSTIGKSLSSQGGGPWYANASSELAQASYELNALITQSTAAAGVDRAA